MVQHLYVAGVERWPPANDNLDIEQALTYQIDACSFYVAGEQPTEGDEVIVEDNIVGRLFAGIIVKVELVDKDLKIWAIDCDDYTALLDRYLVVETYENMTADAIFKDIAVKYCPGFTLNGVQTGAPLVEYIVFDYIHPSECFKQLCDYIGWHWQPDYFMDLQFFSAENLASPAPLILVPGGPFRFGKHTIDTQGLRNRVYVRGGTMLSDPLPVEWKADGVARVWNLPWGPHECSLKVGEVPVTMGIENVDADDGSYDYFLNYQEKYIKCANTTTTPAVGTTMSLMAKQDIDVITMIEDLESQAAIAAAQGGDGVYEYVVVDDSLITIQAAEAAGLADLREHANPNVSGSFETEVPGWKPGQLVDINLPDRGVEGTFLVQKVTIARNSGFWTYSIQYGGRLFGIADFLKALVSAQQKKKLAETSILSKIQRPLDIAVVTEMITITPRTPPFRCGDPDAICGLVVSDSGGDWIFLGNMPVQRNDWVLQNDEADFVFLGSMPVPRTDWRE